MFMLYIRTHPITILFPYTTLFRSKVARGVQQLFELDEVILIPACVPPHKRGAGITSVFHRFAMLALATQHDELIDRKSTRLNSSHMSISYAVFCLKKKN